MSLPPSPPALAKGSTRGHAPLPIPASWLYFSSLTLQEIPVRARERIKEGNSSNLQLLGARHYPWSSQLPGKGNVMALVGLMDRLKVRSLKRLAHGSRVGAPDPDL